MSELIGIVGESGTGKSTSVRTLDPKETVKVQTQVIPHLHYHLLSTHT